MSIIRESALEYFDVRITLYSQVDPNMSSYTILHFLFRCFNSALLPLPIRAHPAMHSDFLMIARDERKTHFIYMIYLLRLTVITRKIAQGRSVGEKENRRR